MRILHTSDWHLGRTLHGVDLLDHQGAHLDHLVEVVRAEDVDAVLVAGDVFDRAVPPVPAVELLATVLRRLAEHTRVVLTPGNHDSAIRLGFGAHLFTERVRIRCRIPEVGQPVVLPDGTGEPGALVYPMPYLEPDVAREQLREESGEAPERSHEAVAAAAMRRVAADLGRRSGASRVPAVVMAHAFVVGGQASESERDIRVGGVDAVPAGVFAAAGVDYVALGHLHGPQRVGPQAATGTVLRYAGSPLAYSFSEQAHRKSSALVDLGPAGVRSVQLVEAPVPRRLADVTGTLEELMGRRFDDLTSAWTRVTVTDDVRPRDVYGSVLARFPHALVVQHRPASRSGAGGSPVVTSASDPLEVAGQFVAEVGGRPPTPEEVAVLRASYEGALALERSA